MCKYIVYFFYCVRHLTVLAYVYVISVIMKVYTISYTAICYLVNRLGTQFAVLY